MTLTTSLPSENEDPRYVEPRYVELLVSFYSPPEDNNKNVEKDDFKVIIPRSWTPMIINHGTLNQT